MLSNAAGLPLALCPGAGVEEITSTEEVRLAPHTTPKCETSMT